MSENMFGGPEFGNVPASAHAEDEQEKKILKQEKECDSSVVTEKDETTPPDLDAPLNAHNSSQNPVDPADATTHKQSSSKKFRKDVPQRPIEHVYPYVDATTSKKLECILVKDFDLSPVLVNDRVQLAFKNPVRSGWLDVTKAEILHKQRYPNTPFPLVTRETNSASTSAPKSTTIDSPDKTQISQCANDLNSEKFFENTPQKPIEHVYPYVDATTSKKLECIVVKDFDLSSVMINNRVQLAFKNPVRSGWLDVTKAEILHKQRYPNTPFPWVTRETNSASASVPQSPVIDAPNTTVHHATNDARGSDSSESETATTNATKKTED